MEIPFVLNEALGIRLREAITTAASGSANAGHRDSLQTALDNPEVQAIVVMIHLRGQPKASILQLVTESDHLGDLAKLACI